MVDQQIQNEFQPDFVISPGDVLSYELELRDMSQQELAKRTGITPKHIVSVIKGKSPISPETAIKLERATGMPVEYWLNLESQYQEHKARAAEEELLERNLDWLKKIPLAAMSELGWLDKPKDKKQQLVKVLQFFGIAKVEQWDDMWPSLNVAYRQHNAHEVFPEAVSAWLRKGELESAEIECQPYDRSLFRERLDEVRNLTSKLPDRFVPEMQALCASAGVAVVFVPALPKSGVSGATRWLNSNKAVIQLSLRYKTNDHLWFTFFHEAGHILLHGKKELFLETNGKGNNGLDEEKEEQANQFAQNELIPKKLLSEFIRIGLFSKASIIAFAKKIGIAPGIVVGQLQHRRLLSYRHCNDLKKTYKWTHE